MLRAFPVGLVLGGSAPLDVYQHVGFAENDSFGGSRLVLIFEQGPAQEGSSCSGILCFTSSDMSADTVNSVRE